MEIFTQNTKLNPFYIHTLDSKRIETFPIFISNTTHFQTTNTAHISLEVLDLDFVK